MKANDAGGEEVVLEDELQKSHVVETTRGSSISGERHSRSPAIDHCRWAAA